MSKKLINGHKPSELMGKLVVYTHTLFREYRCVYDAAGNYRDWNAKVWEPRELHSPRTGWFMGMRTLQNGEREYEQDVGYAWKQTSSVNCVLIAPHPQLKPVFVTYGCFRLATEADPAPYVRKPYYTESMRESMRKEAALFERDAQGRFTGRLKGEETIINY